ncbi:hypothetical protein VCHA53O466_50529 [Vibrio chagasii]|nr:hypothetical protein VCHA53O466_50529 [Vibrio chagasii]
MIFVSLFYIAERDDKKAHNGKNIASKKDNTYEKNYDFTLNKYNNRFR